ncbi:MAG: ABC transporter permease [bacterium]
MNLEESFSVSINGLTTHKLRTFLTMLGIIFGVAAVIAMLSIGAGAKKEALDQIKVLGLNNIILHSEPIESESDEYGTVIESLGLTVDDSRSLHILNPLVKASVPLKVLEDQLVLRRDKEMNTVVAGTVTEYKDVLNFEMESGNFFNYNDVHEARKVCVIGSQVKRELFYFQRACGEEIKIGDLWFTVVGVLKSKLYSSSQGGIMDRDVNKDIYIPLSSLNNRFDVDPSQPEVDQIVLNIADDDRIREAANLANRLIYLRHNKVEDYKIVVPEELLQQRQKTQRIFNIVMGAIAGISLLVGGIGIMNIMLASILERTREIGVRRAVGATRRDILGQFLIEAVMLSFTGGLLGILLGFIMTKIIAMYADWKTIVDIGAIMLAFFVSAAVGIIFGIYPARKAAKLDPIESLRYE